MAVRPEIRRTVRQVGLSLALFANAGLISLHEVSEEQQANQKTNTTEKISYLVLPQCVNLIACEAAEFASVDDLHIARKYTLHRDMPETTAITTPPPEAPSTTSTTIVTHMAYAPAAYSGGPSGILRRIGGCESAGSASAPIDYTAQNPVSTASGGYQILDSTWADYDGYSKAKYAPPSVQDEKALLLYEADGTHPWVSSEACWG